MAKQRPLTSAQQGFLRYLSDGKWHPWSGQAITGSGLRGLMSRGLIERLHDPNESVWTWVRSGRFRLANKNDKQNALRRALGKQE